jgi:ribosomal protein S27AE
MGLTMRIQDKVMAKIQEIVESAGLDFVTKAQYSNTGTIFAQKDFTTIWETYYSFQDKQVTLGNWASGKCGQDWLMAHYGNEQEMKALFAFIQSKVEKQPVT